MATEEIIGNNAVAAVTDKPFKFEGSHFKRWQAKMKFFLTIKKCAHVLTEDTPLSHLDTHARAPPPPSDRLGSV